MALSAGFHLIIIASGGAVPCPGEKSCGPIPWRTHTYFVNFVFIFISLYPTPLHVTSPLSRPTWRRPSQWHRSRPGRWACGGSGRAARCGRSTRPWGRRRGPGRGRTSRPRRRTWPCPAGRAAGRAGGRRRRRSTWRT
jgi:hypothetical protein